MWGEGRRHITGQIHVAMSSVPLHSTPTTIGAWTGSIQNQKVPYPCAAYTGYMHICGKIYLWEINCLFLLKHILSGLYCTSFIGAGECVLLWNKIASAQGYGTLCRFFECRGDGAQDNLYAYFHDPRVRRGGGSDDEVRTSRLSTGPTSSASEESDLHSRK